MRLSVRAALTPPYAQMLELVYTSGLRSDTVRIGGSSPSAGTICACDGTGIRARLKPWCPKGM